MVRVINKNKNPYWYWFSEEILNDGQTLNQLKKDLVKKGKFIKFIDKVEVL